jgi:hypothetical protein
MNRMRFGSFIAGLLAVVVVAFSVPRTARADDDRARFAGTFRFGGATAEEAARRAAIDRTVGSLFFAIRGIARSRLSSGTRIDPWVSFAFGDGKIRMRVPSSTEASSSEQGSVTEYVNNGERSRLSQRLASGKLTQLFVADEGRRMNEWTLTPDGSTLVLKVTVSSSKLSTPLVYVLTYKRSP